MIGSNIKSRRNELKLTQTDLAEKVSISVRHISYIETNARTPSLGVALKIAQALNTTIDKLNKEL